MFGDMLPAQNDQQIISRLVAFPYPESRCRAGLAWLFHAVRLSICCTIFRAAAWYSRRDFFPGLAVLALLAGLFGFLRAKPKEIWSYGFLTWAPQTIFGAAWATSRGWLAGHGLVLVVSSLLAAVVGVLASYAGFALGKVVNRIRADPERASEHT